MVTYQIEPRSFRWERRYAAQVIVLSSIPVLSGRWGMGNHQNTVPAFMLLHAGQRTDVETIKVVKGQPKEIESNDVQPLAGGGFWERLEAWTPYDGRKPCIWGHAQTLGMTQPFFCESSSHWRTVHPCVGKVLGLNLMPLPWWKDWPGKRHASDVVVASFIHSTSIYWVSFPCQVLV